MIIAIERSKFNILYKYDQISIALSSVIDSQMVELQYRISNQRIESLVRDLDRILPVFELDHEVLLLEIDRSKIGFGSDITVSFDSVVGIYPLTREGANLLSGKLNDNIKVGFPSLEQAIQRVKAERTIRLRVNCARKLLDLFGAKVAINPVFRDNLQASIKSIVYGNGSSLQDGNFIYSLLTYDKTPSYLPSGNAEYITKVGVVTLVALKKDDALIKNGSLYKKCLDNRNLINRGSIFDGLNNLETLLVDSELRASYDKVIESINPKFDNLQIFKIAYYFIALKAYLNKTEKNLLGIAQQLFDEVQKDPETFAHVLLLIGYTFSYEELYESIHSLEQSRILKNTLKLTYNKKEPAVIAQLEEKNRVIEEAYKHVIPHQPLPVTTNREPVDSLPPKENYPTPNANESQEIPLPQKSDANTILKLEITNRTVRDFEKWIATNGPEKKRKKWAEFISQHFPVKDNFITLEDLATALNKKSIPESDLFIKTGKNKFDGMTINQGFFKK